MNFGKYSLSMLFFRNITLSFKNNIKKDTKNINFHYEQQQLDYLFQFKIKQMEFYNEGNNKKYVLSTNKEAYPVQRKKNREQFHKCFK